MYFKINSKMKNNKTKQIKMEQMRTQITSLLQKKKQ